MYVISIIYLVIYIKSSQEYIYLFQSKFVLYGSFKFFYTLKNTNLVKK